MAMDDIQQVRQIWESLELPGIIDVHTHFMPNPVMDKVGSTSTAGARRVLRRLPDLGDRILFDSDFPNIPHDYAAAMTAITSLDGIDDDWLRGVFYTNAARLFGLTPG